jgi:arginase family enzyme
MMDISVFFSFCSKEQFDTNNEYDNRLVNSVHFFSGDLSEFDGKKLAIIGVKEDRNSGINKGCSKGPDIARREFYKLFPFDRDANIIDLGNIEAGNEITDTYYALNHTCQFLLKKNIIPIIIGGSQDLTYANYLAYETLEQTVNLVTIDPKLNFGQSPDDLSSAGYLNKIVLHKPNFLFNYSNIGHQRYLTDPQLIELMSKMYFDTFRLGEMQHSHILRNEPIIRNADILSIDMSAIRRSESPGCAEAGPNGFYGHEAAQLAWYAGLSDKLSSFGIYEFNPEYDRDSQSAQLVAQMIWCFIDGHLNRKADYPIGDHSEYLRYIVNLAQESHELVFYKSNRSDRWWMDVPYPAGQENRYERHHLVPCTYEEYQQATNDEMPDRWWKTYQKLV